MIEVYGKPDCGYCIKAKNILKEHEIPFKYYTVGQDIDVGSVLERFPGARTVPIIVVNGNWIGGYDDLKEHLEDTSNGFGDDF